MRYERPNAAPSTSVARSVGPRRFALLLVIGVLLPALAGCGNTSFLIVPVRAAQGLEEATVLREGAWARDKIALIAVSGMIENERDRNLAGIWGENPVSLFKEKLDRAAADRRVKAVVIRINSPGGTVTGSDLMYSELLAFRQRTGKPVIASMLDVAASGGYYVACAADTIYAHPTTVTGSIGVLMLAPEITGTMAKLGVRMHVFKSGGMKDAGSMFRPMDPDEEAMFQGLIDQMYARFLSVVHRARANLSEARLRELADGRVFLGPEAHEVGLVDEIGGLPDAMRAAKRAANLADQDVLVVQYARPLRHRPNIYARGGDAPAQVNLLNITAPDCAHGPSPKFLYLWAPGW